MGKVPFKATLKHIGINAQNNENAERLSEMISELLGLEIIPTEKSIFLGTAIEIMREPFMGEKGHIGFDVSSIEEVEEYVTSMGHPFIESTKKYDENGKLTIAYLEGDFDGFSIHLSRG